MRRLFALILALLMVFSITAPVLACDPPPEKPQTPKYIDCEDLGSRYQFGFRLAGARNGTYQFTSRAGALTGGAPQDTRNTVTISGSSGRVFDWSSTLGMDAVIIHAGGTSTVKKMDERASGEHFYGRVGRDRKPYKIDGITFCYDYELSVSASARGTQTSAGEWTITKTVDVPAQSKLAGETATFQYTVAVDGAEGSPTGFEVTTEVIIQNNTPVKAAIEAVKNYLPAWRESVRVDCGEIQLPYRMEPWSELKCSATTAVDSLRGGESIAEVRVRGLRDTSAAAEIQWDGSSGGGPTGSVTITDTNAAFGGPYTVSKPSTWTYAVDLTCPTDPAVYTDGLYTMTLDNTAAIVETDRKASQSVALTCYAPTVSAAGVTTYDLAYEWGITKTSPLSSLTLKQNEAASVGYNVVVSVVGQVEKNFHASGTVVVRNPHPEAGMTVSLLDAGTQAFPAALSGCANPLTIPAGESVTCTYEALSETAPEQGAIQVWINDLLVGSVSADSFSKSINKKIDACVTVYDDAFTEPLGSACADQAPAAYAYELPVGPFDTCGDTDYINTASFITNDTQTTDYANWQVLIQVTCTGTTNCTYNAAYWIVHGNPGDPSLYSATWDQIQPGGPNTPFYETGSTWIAILSDTSASGVYDSLAREYIVGRLNVLNGSDATPQLLAMLDHAGGLLAQYAADRNNISDEAIVQDFNATREALKNYNEGITGPGLCPDCI